MRCAIKGCSVNNKGKNFSNDLLFHFHSFPKDEKLSNQWVSLCCRNEKFNKDTSRICSKHFPESDYAGLNPFLKKLGMPMKALRLKRNVVPSLLLPFKNEDICSKSAKRNQDDVTEFLPQPATDSEGAASLGIAENGIDNFTPMNVKLELLDDSLSPAPYQINSSARMDQLTTLHEQLGRKCDASTIGHCLVCKGDGTLPNFIPSGKVPLSCNAPKRKNTWNLEEPNTNRWHRVQLQFINHVLLIWVYRCRNGNQKIIFSDFLLKTKAQEAGKILDTFIVCNNTWLNEFKDKLREEDARQSQNYVPQLCDKSKDIADIIDEEWTRFRCEDYNSLSPDISQSEVKEENLDIQSYEEALAIPLGDKSNIMETSIKSYQEALECLNLVKRYAFCVQNLNAVVIITELEDILKLECL